VAASQKLRALKAAGASHSAIRRAKKKVNNAFRDIEKACGAKFDVTGVSGSFEATVTAQDHDDSCNTTKDAHWTSSLGSGSATAEADVYYVKRNGRPTYEFGGEVPTLDHGPGTVKVTCSEAYPASNGTSTCTFDLSPPGQISLLTDTLKPLDPQTITWGYGYNSFSYANPANGGTCNYSGPRPPFVETSIDSPGLFVNPLNDGSNGLEPPGASTLAASQYEHSFSLDFSGSTSNSFDSTLDFGTLNASWHMSISLQRR
jgi:hypothetical protein